MNNQNETNPNNLPGTITPQEATESLQKLQEEKAITQAVNGPKSAYVKALVYQNHQIWWKRITADMQSEDPDISARACAEFNKLQARVASAELNAAEEGDGIVLKLINYNRSRNEEETTD